MPEPAEKLILVSSNPNKAIEAERILGMPLLRVSIGLPEIQAADVEDVTRYKLEAARSKGYGRLVVEDVALGFDQLGNFPGPFVRWLLEAAGGTGLAVIAYALRDRSACAQCCAAYWDGSAGHVFLGEKHADNERRTWLGRVVSAAGIGEDVRRNVTRRERPRLASRRRLSQAGRALTRRKRPRRRAQVSSREDSAPKPAADRIRTSRVNGVFAGSRIWQAP